MAELRKPDERTCERCGRTEVWDDDHDAYTMRFDRDEIREIADRLGPDPKYDHTPGEEIPVVELVDTMRVTEEIARRGAINSDSAVTKEIAFGYWIAMAAIRHDFAIEDELWIDVEDYDKPP